MFLPVVMEGPHGLGIGKGGKPSLWLFQSVEKPAHLHIAFAAPSREGSTPECPLARKSTVSLVLVSPSTEIALNVWSTTRFQNGRSVPGSDTASVVITPSSVAMSG